MRIEEMIIREMFPLNNTKFSRPIDREIYSLCEERTDLGREKITAQFSSDLLLFDNLRTGLLQ